MQVIDSVCIYKFRAYHQQRYSWTTRLSYESIFSKIYLCSKVFYLILYRISIGHVHSAWASSGGSSGSGEHSKWHILWDEECMVFTMHCNRLSLLNGTEAGWLKSNIRQHIVGLFETRWEHLNCCSNRISSIVCATLCTLAELFMCMSEKEGGWGVREGNQMHAILVCWGFFCCCFLNAENKWVVSL